MRHPRRARASLLAISLLAGPAFAGPYADDMAKCLVKSASAEDRTQLVRWMFSAMTLHPDLASMSAVTAKQRDELNQSTAAQFMRLLTESCKAESQQAYQNEGPQTIQYAFSILGGVASRGLFSDPHVAAGMQSMAKGFDEKRIRDALGMPAPASAAPAPAPAPAEAAPKP